MKRDTQARVLAVTVLLGALAAGAAGRAGWFGNAGAPALTPEEAISAAIYSTTNAARAGDVNRYLDGYTGPLRAALQRSLRESGAPAFVSYLRSLDVGVKGLAVWVERSTESEAKARVEYVYQERNDVQFVYLENHRGAWRIARTGGDQPAKAAIPYGTPIR